MTTENRDFWADAEVIHTYSRAQAIEDGVLIDANIGDLAEVTRQHYKVPVAMTAEVFGLIDRAVKNKRWCNDYRGVWHDILWMSRWAVIRRPDPSTVVFRVAITGVGRQKWHQLKAVCGPNDDGEPCLTVMLPNED